MALSNVFSFCCTWVREISVSDAECIPELLWEDKYFADSKNVYGKEVWRIHEATT